MFRQTQKNREQKKTGDEAVETIVSKDQGQKKPLQKENTPVQKEKSCGAVVYRRMAGTIEFLLEHMVQGHTSIPKGHVENNETEEETAEREIREETNLEVRLDTGFRHVITYSPSPNVIKDVVFFVAEAIPGRMVNQECEVKSLEWMPYREAAEALTHESDRETLKRAFLYVTKEKCS